MPVSGKWLEWSEDDLCKWRLGDREQRDYAEEVMAWYAQYERNRFAFFLAHGGSKDFLNDLEHTTLLLRAGNQQGKTFALLAWIILHSIELDPNWPCFTQNGLSWRRVVPKGRAGLASYSWAHMRRNIWPKLQELMPVDVLRDYSPLWYPKDSRIKVKEPSWLHNPSVPLSNGLTLDFYAYGQRGSAVESCTYQFWGLDEQVNENFFDGAFARGTGVEDFVVAIAYTPHKVDGWSHSGAGTWIHRLDSGVETKGLNYKTYYIAMKDVPDAIISAKKKKEYYNKYIIAPRATGNLKAIRAGRARWFGEYEAGEGLVYDNWIPWVHLIDPFPIPPEWPRVRGIDPGRVEPFCALWCAISPWNDIILYRTYYESGYGLEENAKRIIVASGNIREKVDTVTDFNGNARQIWREQFKTESYQFTVIDPRSYATDSDLDGLKVGQVIADYGLDCVPGSGMHNERAVMLVKEWLEINSDRIHVLVRMKLREKIVDKEGNELKGAPQFYVLRNASNKPFVGEIENYVNRSVGDKERPVDKNDHAMCVVKYLRLAEPHYVGPQAPASHMSKTHANKYTGFSASGHYLT